MGNDVTKILCSLCTKHMEQLKCEKNSMYHLLLELVVHQ